MATTVGKRILKCVAALALFLVTLEMACQAYAWRLERQWKAVRKNPDHYFQASADAILAYELRPNCVLRKDGRDLRINRFGIRDDSDSVPQGRRTIAVLGDSVVFGTGFSQDQTISALLQKKLPADAVLNFGVPGYNLPELVELLRTRAAVCKPATVIFLLNPNDFCRRDSVYEGADNGLYRMYSPPRWKSPWFFGKLVYRFHKGGIVSPGWYRWIFDGNRDRGLAAILEMAGLCKANGATFLVVLLPAGCAYAGGDYQLRDIAVNIVSALQADGLRVVNPIAAFGASPQTLFTDTDHLTAAGNELMASIMSQALKDEGL